MLGNIWPETGTTMSAKTPTVSAGWLYDPRQPDTAIALDSAAWYAWLESGEARSFSYPVFDARCGSIVGFLTVRREGRQRGGSYWRVYRRSQGRVRKFYLGRAQQVTRARLVAIVRTLLAEREQCPEEEVLMTLHH